MILTITTQRILEQELNMAKTTYTKTKQSQPTPPSPGGETPTISIRGIKGIKATLSSSGRYYNISGENLLDRITALEGKTDNFVTGVTASREGNKVKLTYNFVTGQPKTVEFDDKDTIGIAYDDTALRNRVKALEDKSGGVVHRFYNGDIPGVGNPNETPTVSKNNFRNPDGIKVGDTVEDHYATSDGVNRGIWKVIEVSGNNVKVQGIGHYDINLRKNLSFNANTRVLSIDGGNNVTIPSDKQTLSLEGNKLKLTNGGEVNLDKYVAPTLRIVKDNIREPAIFEAKTTIPLSSLANKDGVKPNDIVQDIRSYPSGVIEFNYWKVTAVEGDNAKLLFMYQDLTNGYNDEELRRKIATLEKRPTPTNQRLSLSGNTLSLTDGGSVTLPSQTAYNDADIKKRLTALEGKADNDKQTLTIQGNTLSISNGNSVNIPQPNLSGYVPVAEYNKVKGALEKLLTDLKNSGAWRQTGSTVFEGELHSNRNIATGNINIFGGTVDGNSFIRTNNGRTENDLAGGI